MLPTALHVGACSLECGAALVCGPDPTETLSPDLMQFVFEKISSRAFLTPADLRTFMSASKVSTVWRDHARERMVALLYTHQVRLTFGVRDVRGDGTHITRDGNLDEDLEVIAAAVRIFEKTTKKLMKNVVVHTSVVGGAWSEVRSALSNMVWGEFVRERVVELRMEGGGTDKVTIVHYSRPFPADGPTWMRELPHWVGSFPALKTVTLVNIFVVETPPKEFASAVRLGWRGHNFVDWRGRNFVAGELTITYSVDPDLVLGVADVRKLMDPAFADIVAPTLGQHQVRLTYGVTGDENAVTLLKDITTVEDAAGGIAVSSTIQIEVVIRMSGKSSTVASLLNVLREKVVLSETFPARVVALELQPAVITDDDDDSTGMDDLLRHPYSLMYDLFGSFEHVGRITLVNFPTPQRTDAMRSVEAAINAAWSDRHRDGRTPPTIEVRTEGLK